MAYNKAQRDEIVLTNQGYRQQISGCLYTHARYLYDVDHETRPAGELACVLSILADTTAFITATGRAVLFYPSNDALADITALTDQDIMDLIPAVWPMLVSAWRGEVVVP